MVSSTGRRRSFRGKRVGLSNKWTHKGTAYLPTGSATRARRPCGIVETHTPTHTRHSQGGIFSQNPMSFCFFSLLYIFPPFSPFTRNIFFTLSEPWGEWAINLQIIWSVKGSRSLFFTIKSYVLSGHTYAHKSPSCCESWVRRCQIWIQEKHLGTVAKLGLRSQTA